MRGMIACLAFACAIAAPARAQDITAEVQARLDLVLRIGKEINDHDQSAWHVTDALMKIIPAKLNSKHVGYVTERVDEAHVKTIFILDEGGRAEIIYAGLYDGDSVEDVADYTRSGSRPLATPAQVKRLETSFKLIEEYPEGVCGERPNVIAFPALDGMDATDYFMLVPETEVGQVQFGGHLRIRIGADGAREEKDYSNSCIAMQANVDEHETIAVLAITVPMNISDIPTEIHVFKSLSHRAPVIVKSGLGYWEILGDKIELIGPPDPEDE